MLFKKFGFLQCPKIMGCRKWLQQWAFYSTRKFEFTVKSFILESLTILGKILNSWQCLPWAKFRLLATNFICTHLHDGAISVCIHALLGLETLRDSV